VLDIGPGAYQPWVAELVRRGHLVWAIDHDPEAVAAVVRRLPVVAMKQGDGKTEPLQHFDLVTCISVIEHDPDWRAFLHHVLGARRLLLTFGVVPAGASWPGMFVDELAVLELGEVINSGTVYLEDGFDLRVPPDAVRGREAGLLTFAVATGRP
jgi:hypothetical protein